MKRELKIGIFMAIALFILAVFIFIVGDLTVIFRKKGYDLYAGFDSVAGLEKNAIVRMAGVKAGYVKDIRLHGRQAQVLMSIDPRIQVPKGSKATLAALGLLGEKYIEILPGEGKDYCQPEEAIDGLPPVSFDQMGTLLLSIGDEVKEMGESLRGMIGGEEAQAHFKDTLQNLSALTTDLNDVFGTNKEELSRGFKSSSQAIQKFDQSVEEVSQNLDELISLLKETVEENREGIKVNMKSIKELIQKTEESLRLLNESLDKINKGEGTVGRLVHEPELYNRVQKTMDELEGMVHTLSGMRFSLGLRADYYGESEFLKPTLTLWLWPMADKFIMTQAIRDPWLEKFTYSAQAGLRWRNLSPRAGIIESKFGAGLDYYLVADRLRFSLEGYDFNRQPRPRFKLWTQYAVSKYLYILLGVDDFTLAPKREVFFGFGLGLS